MGEREKETERWLELITAVRFFVCWGDPWFINWFRRHQLMSEPSVCRHQLMSKISFRRHQLESESSVCCHQLKSKILFRRHQLKSNQLMSESSVWWHQLISEVLFCRHQLIAESSVCRHRLISVISFKTSAEVGVFLLYLQRTRSNLVDINWCQRHHVMSVFLFRKLLVRQGLNRGSAPPP